MNNIIKRVRQFIAAITAKMEPSDHDVITRYLNKTEQDLFYQMDTAIQRHCINVACTLDKIFSGQAVTALPASEAIINKDLLYKAALLHDIGKGSGQLTVWDRVWFVLVRRITPQQVRIFSKSEGGKCFSRIRHAFYIHICHAEIGAELALRNKLPDDIIFLIRHHHDRELPDDPSELIFLRYADELN